jgi:hypothetical protein
MIPELRIFALGQIVCNTLRYYLRTVLYILIALEKQFLNTRFVMFLDPSFSDVSGLPDPYSGLHPQHQQQHQTDAAAASSLAHAQQQLVQVGQHQQQFDESSVNQQQQQQQQTNPAESGYSTPNSRNRRIIREIIV